MTTLRDIGLSEYEATVYRTLLSTGPATAKTLSQASEVPMGRIYDVLSDLVTAGMVRSQNAGRPKKYAAVEPETALERRLESKRNEIETELSEYEAAVEALADQLEAADPAEPFWTVAVGPDDSVTLLEERLGTATDRIIMVADTPSAEFDPVELSNRLTAEVETALDRGVEVSMLMAPGVLEVIPNDIRRRHQRTVMDHSDFEIRVAPDINGGFTLIDRVEILIEVPNPLHPGEMLAIIDLTDPSFAADLHEEFRPRWEQASQAPTV